MKKKVLSLVLCIMMLTTLFIPEGLVAAQTGDTARITVNYVYESNNAMVAQPYSATVPTNQTFQVTIALPEILNYSITAESINALPEGVALDSEENLLSINLSTVTEDVSVVLYYAAGQADYTVNHWVQILDSDEYELEKSVELTGDIDAYTEAVADNKEGFTSHVEQSIIAPDDTTEVNIYYDRISYTVVFDANGGIGASDPIYAEYGTVIEESYIMVPTRIGYVFQGWSPAIEYTVTEDVTYVAQWELESEISDYTIVIWGQNANDDDYSYISSHEAFGDVGSTVTWNEDTLICQGAHVHNADCYELTCGYEEHQHDESCSITCGLEEHTHTQDCCSKEEHNHTTSCYDPSSVGDELSWWDSRDFPSNPTEGQIYSEGSWIFEREYIYINGSWYEYSGDVSDGAIAPTICGESEHTHGDGNCNTENCDNQEEHTHTDSCYNCGKTEHTHIDSCYELTCGIQAHTQHTDDCYMSSLHPGENLWVYETCEEVTIAADGSTVLNVYFNRREFTLTFREGRNTVYTITERWGKDISSHWPIEGTNGTTYDNGERWDPSGSDTYTEVLVFIQLMPAESFTLTVDRANYDDYVMHYYVEVIDGEGEREYGDRYFTEAFSVTANYNFVTETEDFFDIEGYTQWRSDPSFRNGEIDIWGGGDVYFYYTRNEYTLNFFSGNNNTPVHSENVKYQENLGQYNYTPTTPPEGMEEDAQFVGWYQNPECTGEEYILSEHTMPANDMALYAKWVNGLYTVRTFTDETMEEFYTYDGYNGVQDNIVKYTLATAPTDPTKEGEVFVGWFYNDNGEEKPFSFTMPITRNYDLYPKFSDEAFVSYTGRYLELGTNTPLADDKTGTARIGSNVTERAKMGDELNLAPAGTNYFPLQTGTSITLNRDGQEIIFYYTPATEIQYTVRYVNASGEDLISSVTKTTADSVVTETYVEIEGYTPRQYQQTRELSANAEDNVIVFVYDSLATELEIWKKGADEALDPDANFVFNIKGIDENTSHIDLTVTINGNCHINITDLPVGEYTVEETDWSWRYTPENKTQEITLSAGENNQLIFENSRAEDQLLDGEASCVNEFVWKQE